MLEQRNNPTCTAATYSGGLQCCYDGFNLLDADQDIPPLVTSFRFKIRVYFEDYVPVENPPLQPKICSRTLMGYSISVLSGRQPGAF